LFAVFFDELRVKDYAADHGFMGFFGVGDEFGENLGFGGGDVVEFLDVLGEVVEFPVAFGFVGFPVLHADCGLVAVFPVEVLVFLLVAGFAQ